MRVRVGFSSFSSGRSPSERSDSAPHRGHSQTGGMSASAEHEAEVVLEGSRSRPPAEQRTRHTCLVLETLGPQTGAFSERSAMSNNLRLDFPDVSHTRMVQPRR